MPFGWQVRYWECSISARCERRLNGLRIEPLRFDSDHEHFFKLPPYDLPSRSLSAVIDRETQGLSLGSIHMNHKRQRRVKSGIKVGLLKGGSEFFERIRSVATWQLSEPQLSIVYLARSRWETVILGELPICARQVRIPVLRFNRFTIRRIIWRFRPARADNLTGSDAVSHEPSGSQTEASTSQVIIVFNLDDRFSNLYEYSNFYSSQDGSPLHPDRMALMSRDGGRLSSGRVASPWPQDRNSAPRVIKTLWRAMCIKHQSTTCSWFFALKIGHLLERSMGVAVHLQRAYPQARAACFAYDIQVPIYLSLAFFFAGIRTFAYQERIDASMAGHSPHAVDTLFVASDFFGVAARDNYASSLATTSITGLWRTDLIYESRTRGRTRPQNASRSRLVVVLPYRVDTRTNPPGDTLSMSSRALASFLDDVLLIAKKWPTCRFVIRAKDNDWASLPELDGSMRAISDQANVTTDDDYTELNRTYSLVSGADLVIGNFSSIIDEVLAVGIPAFVRDFTPNASNLRSGVFDYLPAGIVCRSSTEFMTQVNQFLGDNGLEYRRRWHARLRRMYGDMNDGNVRRRGQEAVLDYLRALPQSVQTLGQRRNLPSSTIRLTSSGPSHESFVSDR